jgi:hypothetical protein
MCVVELTDYAHNTPLQVSARVLPRVRHTHSSIGARHLQGVVLVLLAEATTARQAHVVETLTPAVWGKGGLMIGMGIDRVYFIVSRVSFSAQWLHSVTTRFGQTGLRLGLGAFLILDQAREALKLYQIVLGQMNKCRAVSDQLPRVSCLDK